MCLAQGPQRSDAGEGVMLIVFLDIKFSISGSSYTTVPDHIPTLGCQIHL